MDIKTLHRELLELLTIFDAICKKNNIRYTLHGGSLLGAIREQGFIPWDDDADIAMTRSEFEKLTKVLKKDNEYYIYGDIKKQFRKKEDETFWIDIFICDYIGEKFSRKLKLSFLTMLDIMNRDKVSIRMSNLSQYSQKKQMIFKCLYFLGKMFPKKIKSNLYNNIAEYRWLGDKTMMHRSNDQYKGRKETFPKFWMEKFHDVPFEYTYLSVMDTYHEMLTKCYGKDYMIPVKDTRNQSVHDIVRASRDGEIKL